MAELIDAPIVDIRKIRNQREVIRYVGKYITKAPAQFNGSKRYWTSAAYELGKEEWKKDHEAPSFHWQVSRLSIEVIIEEWRRSGYMVARTASGEAIGERADETFWPAGPPPWAPWSARVLLPSSSSASLGLQSAQGGLFDVQP
ncbi:MAG TPA: hypothetical protein VFS35_04655 [Terrimicrobiaceae bacterium]|nr:hypothetical protein [Terrimicrobiaceae bacterium]